MHDRTAGAHAPAASQCTSSINYSITEKIECSDDEFHQTQLLARGVKVHVRLKCGRRGAMSNPERGDSAERAAVRRSPVMPPVAKRFLQIGRFMFRRAAEAADNLNAKRTTSS